ncbi:MAG: SDR family NAD(P)-dependent oxidoreductase [Steroidobacteraceae bacterium]
MSNRGFENQVVIVTGAGQGLGRCYALELAKRGAAVLVNDIGSQVDGTAGLDRRVATGVVDEIVAAGGRAAASFDSVTTPEGAQQIVTAALDHFGRIDAVVHNAGTVRFAPFEATTLDDYRVMVDMHIGGTFHVAQAAYRVMQRQRSGRFVLTASNAGLFGIEAQAAYGAGKAGVIGLNNLIAIEGAEYGIRSNAVMPVALTRMAAHAAVVPTKSSALLGDLLPVIESRLKPEFVAPLVLYLASAQCRQTGQVFSAVGGRYSRAVKGVGSGWLAPAGPAPSMEDLAQHWDEVIEVRGLKEPTSGMQEIQFVAEQLKARQ